MSKAERQRAAQRRRTDARRGVDTTAVLTLPGRPGPHADDGCPTCRAMGSGDLGAILAAMTRPSGLPGACPGVRWEHRDGVTECTEGPDCPGDDGWHDLGASCSMSSPAVDWPHFTHRCADCGAPDRQDW